MSSGLKVNSVWKVKEKADEPVTSLIEIMNVELAEQLEEQEAHGVDPSIAQYGLSETELASCADDLALARKLQDEFDREFENTTKKNVKQEKGKFELNFERYRPAYDSDYEIEDPSDIDDDIREAATNLLYSRPVDDFPPCGYVRDASGNVITKHNKEISERKNTDRMLQLSIEFPTGDVVGEKLNNKVFNNLRAYSKVEQRRHTRLKDKDESASSELGVDKATRLILYKWINIGMLDQVENTIATGKESVVLHAMRRADPGNGVGEQHYAVKVYKMNLAKFKNRSEYVQSDYRFKNPRRVLRVWAEKEFMNLKRMAKCAMKCPEPVQLRKHVLIMSLIGHDGAAAPQLKDIEWFDQESKFEAFSQVKQAMVCLYKNCQLVHGDLSEFNILFLDSTVHLIDVAQAIDVSHPRSLFFLLRDIENILAYFERVGTEELPKSVDLFNEITGLDMDPNKNLHLQVERFEKDNRNIQLRLDKAKPADMELRLYNNDVALTHEDPAEPYN